MATKPRNPKPLFKLKIRTVDGAEIARLLRLVTRALERGERPDEQRLYSKDGKWIGVYGFAFWQ